MKQSLAFAYFILLIISLALIVGDSCINNSKNGKNLTPIQKECSDLSTHFEDSHSVCFEDEVIMNVSKIKSNKFSRCIGLIPSLDIKFESYNATNIWQPPKSS